MPFEFKANAHAAVNGQHATWPAWALVNSKRPDAMEPWRELEGEETFPSSFFGGDGGAGCLGAVCICWTWFRMFLATASTTKGEPA